MYSPLHAERAPVRYVAYMHNGWDSARFRDLLEQVMKDAELSQADVATITGISRSQISRWLSGAHRPGFDALQKLAAAVRSRHPRLGGDVDDLLLAAGYEGHSSPPALPAPGAGAAVLPGDDPVLAYVRGLPGLTPDARRRLEYVAGSPGPPAWRFALVGAAIALMQPDRAQDRSA